MKKLVIYKLKLVSYLIEIRQLLGLELMFKTMFNAVFKIMFKIVLETKYNANKNMSFLKITDPKKRDFMVNEFLKTSQNIQKNFLSERVGDLSTAYELSKFFKPVTDMHKYLKEVLVRELKPIPQGMKNSSKTITFLQYPSIRAHGHDGEEEDELFIGDIAEQYLRKIASRSGSDKTFGLRDKDGKF